MPLDPELPCWWPGLEPFSVRTSLTLAEANTFSRNMCLEEHAGTHMDAPCHTGDDAHRPLSAVTGDRLPLASFTGRSRILDIRALRSDTDGVSPQVSVDALRAYERSSGDIRAGDAVLLWSGWTDRYYRPFPEGDEYVKLPLEGRRPGWPAPSNAFMEELAARRVRLIGTDAPTIGALPRLEDAHRAAFRKGITPVENLTNLGEAVAAGESIFLFLPLLVRGSSGSPGRAVAIIPDIELT